MPQKITCVAWSWIGSDDVHSRVCGVEGLFGKPQQRAEMLSELLSQIAEADILTGHNIARFDLPVVNAEAMRLGLEPIRSILVQDTMRLVRAKGFKKGQDVLGHWLKVRDQKMPLDWQQWQDGYAEPDWATIRQRAESDVVMHKQIRLQLLERDLLKPPRKWSA